MYGGFLRFGLRIWGLNFRALRSGFTMYKSCLRLRLRMQGLGLRVEGLGLRV